MDNNKFNKIEGFITKSLKSIGETIDVNTVMGTPVFDGKNTIIPLTKLTYGFLSGGGEYGDVKLYKNNEEHPVAGGGGAIVSLNPVGFLINSGNGFKVVPMQSDMFDKLCTMFEGAINSLNDKK